MKAGPIERVANIGTFTVILLLINLITSLWRKVDLQAKLGVNVN